MDLITQMAPTATLHGLLDVVVQIRQWHLLICHHFQRVRCAAIIIVVILYVLAHVYNLLQD